jgi:hypothetical protein
MNDVNVTLCLLTGNGVDVCHDGNLYYLNVEDVVGVMRCV